MDSKDQNIGSIVKGGFFNSNFLFDNYKLILLLVSVALVSIVSSHSTDTKI